MRATNHRWGNEFTTIDKLTEPSSESAQRVGLGWCQERALNRRFSAVIGTFPSKVWQETGVGIWSLMRDMEQGFNIAN